MRRSIRITSTTSTGYLSQTTAYIAAENAAGGSFTTPQANGIDRWFRDIFGYANGSYPTFDVHAKVPLAYLYLQGVSAARDEINAMSPGTYDGVDTGSPTYNVAGLKVTYNGSSQFTNTGFAPNGATTIATADFSGFGFHRTDTTTGSGINGQGGELGGGNSYINFNGTFRTFVNNGLTAYNQNDANAINGMWDLGWSAANVLNTYYNGGRIKQVTGTTFNNSPSRSLYIGAVHSSSTLYSAGCSYDFWYEKRSTWSDAETLMMYNATKALKAVFGITW